MSLVYSIPLLTRNRSRPNVSIMEDRKGARKSDDITATPIRKALPTSGNQQSEHEQVLPKKPRSALKKDLTAYFIDGKRSPVPTTAGNPIDTAIQRRKFATRHSKGQGRQQNRSGREDGRHQQLAYTYREEKEGQEQGHTSGRGRQGGTA